MIYFNDNKLIVRGVIGSKSNISVNVNLLFDTDADVLSLNWDTLKILGYDKEYIKIMVLLLVFIQELQKFLLLNI